MNWYFKKLFEDTRFYFLFLRIFTFLIKHDALSYRCNKMSKCKGVMWWCICHCEMEFIHSTANELYTHILQYNFVHTVNNKDMQHLLIAHATYFGSLGFFVPIVLLLFLYLEFLLLFVLLGLLALLVLVH
jgi:hypothetical protein